MAKRRTINMVKSQVIYKDYSKDAERTALVSGENLAHMFGKIARWYTDISWVGHKHVVADITDFPALGTAASKDVPASGDAGNNEVVMGNDSRLTDARTPTSHTHSVSEITDFPTLGTAAGYDVSSSGDASNNEVVLGNDSRLTDARTPLSHTHTEADITNLGTYAGASTKGGAATSANKLNIGNSDIGNSTTPVYFDSETGLPIALSYTIEKSVPADAVFTDTTYSTMGPSGSSHAGGLVPDTPSTAGTSKYLREDGTWAVPPNSEYVHPSYTPYSSGLYKITVDALGHVSAASAVTGADLPSHSHTVSDITNFPTLGTAAGYDVPATGDAGDDEVVLGNDSRLTDARTPLSHTHTESDISDLGTYAGSSTKGGAATSANKLNIGSSDIGSETKPVYFNATTGKPVACAYSLNASVPANAVFTDINVKQSPSTANESREVLFAGNTGNTETTGTVGKSNKLYFNPSTGALTATSFSGSVDASNLTGTIDAARLPNSGVTANSYGPAAGGTLTYGGTFDVPYVTVDKYGRLTAASTKTFTMPAQYAHPTYTSKTSGLYKITVDNLGHVSATAAVTGTDLPAHSHTLNMATSTGSSSITLAANTKYQLTAGGSTYIFTTPADTVYTHPTYTEKTNGLYKITVDELGHVSATAAVTASDLPSHTHPYLPDTTKYAGSSSVGGAATSANKLNIGSSNIGNSTTPVYFNSTTGLPVALNYTIEKSVPADAKFTDTVYTHPSYTAKASDLYKITVDELGHVSAASAVTGADLPSHSHNLSIASSTGTSQISLSANTKYQLTAGGSTYIFTTPADTNTTYTVASGDNNGQIKITPSSGDAYNVSVKGLGSAAYTNSSAYATSGHTHTLNIAASSGTSQISLSPNTKYQLTAGGSTYIFTTPPATTMTYSISTGDNNGQIKVTPSSGDAYNVSVKGLGSAAYTDSTAYAAASHTHSQYLPLAGGTMTGHIVFNSVTSTSYPASSNYLYWSGSTDWAKIYYRVDASDAGRLVLDIGDDTNTRIDFAYNGTTKSYIDTNGNFSGNAASATKLGTNAGGAITPVYFSGGKPVACNVCGSSGGYFNNVARIESDGVMEIGAYIDMHTSTNSANDYDYRITNTSTSGIEFGSRNGNNSVKLYSPSGYNQIRFHTAETDKAYNATGITVYPLTVSGSVMVIESGGNMIIGAGESPSSIYSNDYLGAQTAENEYMFVSADAGVVLVSGADTFANKSAAIFDYDGAFRPVTADTLSIGSSTSYWNKAYITQTIGGTGGTWISARDRATVKSICVPASSAFCPVATVKTNNGAWSIGSLGTSDKTTEGLYFSYTTDANYSTGTNAHASYTISTTGAFSGSAAKWTTARTLTIGSTGKSVDGSGNVSWSLSEIGAASSSHTHKYLIDPGASAYKVEVAWEGASVPTSETTYPAVYTTYNMTSGMTIRLKETTWTNVKSFLGLGAAAYKSAKTLSGVSHSGWTNNTTDDNIVATMSFIAFWNGAYASNNASNLQYCNQGKFGSIITKSTSDYIPNTSAGLSAAINLLSTGDSDPVDADYYISQYSGGGTTYTTYHRRPVSKLWNYIKGKADSVYAAKSHSHSYIPLSGSTGITGELASSSANAFRAYFGGYGAFFRNDGNYVYLLFTDKKTDGSEKTASWNSLRPFYCNLSSGYVTMKNGLSVESGLTASDITTTGYLTLGYSNNSTLPSTGIYVNDIRNVNVPASGIGGHLVNFYFHMADSPDTSRWWSIMHVKGWSGDYCAWELAGTAHNTDDRTRPLYVRCSNTNTAWGSWRKIYDTSNKPTLSELGAASSSHTHSSITGPNKHDAAVPTSTVGDGVLTLFYNVDNSSGNMPKTNNANAILQINKHSGEYDSQLGFSSDGNIYYRSALGSAFTTSSPWKQLAWKDDRLGANSDGSYWGMTSPSNDASVWIRTTSLGIIPYQSGGAGSGHCGLGTSSWYFSYAYIDTVYGSLSGRASEASNCVCTYFSTDSYTTNTSYGMLFVADPTITEVNSLRKTDDIRVNYFLGAANTEGLVELVLGNATAKSSANNASGHLTLYNANGKYAEIFPGSNSAHINLTLPSSTGTLALVGDNNHTHSYAGSTTAGGDALTSLSLRLTHDNEVNCSKPPPSYSNIWFFYRWSDGSTEDATGSKYIDSIWFGNGNGAGSNTSVGKFANLLFNNINQGTLRHGGSASSWWNDRNAAMIYQTDKTASYLPIWGCRTNSDGSWCCGNHNGDNLYFNFIPKSVYDSGANPSYYRQIYFTSDAKIEARGYNIINNGSGRLIMDYSGIAMYNSRSGGWADGIDMYNSQNTLVSSIGFYGVDNALQYTYIGGSYAIPLLKIEPSTAVTTIYGTEPYLYIVSSNHTNSGIILQRGTTSDVYTDYRIINLDGDFKIQSNVESDVYANWFDMMTIAYSTGDTTVKGNLRSGGDITIPEGYSIKLRPTHSGYYAGIGYDTVGNECIAMWAKNTVTRLRWHAGIDMSSSTYNQMISLTNPDFEISKVSGTALGYIGGRQIVRSQLLFSGSTTITSGKEKTTITLTDTVSPFGFVAIRFYYSGNPAGYCETIVSSYNNNWMSGVFAVNPGGGAPGTYNACKTIGVYVNDSAQMSFNCDANLIIYNVTGYCEG